MFEKRERANVDLSEKLSASVREQILRDMRPSLAIIYLKSGLAVGLGGAISLLLCGQFGVGITHASLHFTNELHAHAHDFWGALACGIIFAIIPPFILRLLSSPLQFRLITRKSFHSSVVWLVGLGAILAHHGETIIEVYSFLIWAGGAFLTFMIISRIIDRVAQGFALPSAGRRAL